MAPEDVPGRGGRSWSRFRLLAAALVVARGLALVCVLPPFEGWDEYQHVAYVGRAAEVGRPAVLGQSSVPPEFVVALRDFPQPRLAVEQIGRFGIKEYARFWPRSGAPAGALTPAPGEVGLYQAQHGFLYYRLAAPLFTALGGASDLRASVAGLRLANVLLTAAAVWLALGAVGRLVKDGRARALIGLAVASQPLLLMNAARVANDALGVFLATAAVVLGLRLGGKRLPALSAGLGLLTGLAVAAKAVHFGLLPFVGLGWLFAVIRDRTPARRAALSGALVALGFVAVTQGEFRANLARYGQLSAMQEAIHNRRNGVTSADLLRAAGEMPWLGRTIGLWTRDNLITGGWSFLSAGPRLAQQYHWLALAGLVGWSCLLIGPLRRRRREVFPSYAPLPLLLVLCLGYTAALGYHMVHSRLAWGVPTTNPWYAAAAFPWALVLIVGGSQVWPLGRFRVVIPALLSGLFLYAEGRVVWGSMVATYSGGARGAEALRRLASLQPWWLGTPTLLAATAATLVLFAAAAVVALSGDPGRVAGEEHASAGGGRVKAPYAIRRRRRAAVGP